MPAYQSAINNPDLFGGTWSGAGLKREKKRMIDLKSISDKQRWL